MTTSNNHRHDDTDPDTQAQMPSESSKGRSSAKKIAEALASAIDRGRWPVNSRLPSTHEFSRRFQANRATVQRALQLLERRDMVERRERSGWYVKIDRHGGQVEPMLSAKPVHVGGYNTSFSHIAFSVTNIAHPNIFRGSKGETWIGTIVHGLRERLHQEQTDLLLVPPPEPTSKEIKTFLDCLDRSGSSLGGVIITQPSLAPELLKGIEQRDLPWLTINRCHSSQTHNFVSADNFNDGYRIGFIMARMGYRRILYLAGNPYGAPSAREKFSGAVTGYVDAIGHTPDAHQVVCGDSFEETGYKATCQFLKNNDAPDALFSSGDMLSIGAMRACREQMLHVPGDVAIAGSTGLDLGLYTHPSLTATTQPGYKIGVAAAELMLTMARSGYRRVAGRIVPGDLIVRDSLPISKTIIDEAEKALREIKREPPID